MDKILLLHIMISGNVLSIRLFLWGVWLDGFSQIRGTYDVSSIGNAEKAFESAANGTQHRMLS